MLPNTFFLVFCLYGTLGPTADVANLRFQRLGVEAGLSQSTVNEVFQDQTGFIWVATNDGLNRYDGHELRIFKPLPDDATSLSDVAVTGLYEDAAHTLWVITANNGINRYDPVRGSFTRYLPRPATGFTDHLALPDGTLLLADKNGGLQGFHPLTGTYHTYPVRFPDTPPRVSALYRGADGRLWLGTDGAGLWTVPPGSEEARTWENGQGDKVRANAVYAVYRDLRGFLWFGTDNGLFRYREADDSLFHYRHQPGVRRGLVNPIIRACLEDRDGRFWIATDGGLALFDRDTPSFVTFIHDPADPDGMTSNKVLSLYQSRDAVMWVGTADSGLALFNPAALLFGHVRKNGNDPHGLSGNTIWSFAETPEGDLWVGTNDGLNLRDTQTGLFRSWRHVPDDEKSLSHDAVRSVVSDGKGGVWAGTLGGGLNHFDPHTGVFTHWRHDPDDAGTLSDDRILCQHMDRDGRLWIGTFLGGLNLWNGQEGFRRFSPAPGTDGALQSARIWCVASDADRRIWLGTVRGLAHLNPTDAQVTTYSHDPENPRSISHDLVGSVFVDSRGRVWAGTISGLNLLEADGGFRRFRAGRGMLNEYIYGMLEDHRGFLWLGTNHGLVRLNPDTGTADTYLREDGLQSSEFNAGAYLKGTGGRMYFGGIDGYNAFFPERVIAAVTAPETVLTKVLLFNKPVPPDARARLGLDAAPPEHLKALTLTHKDYLFSFEFAALNYVGPDKNRFAYKLEGLDAAWVETDARRRFAGYTHLNPGRYTFLVKSAAAHGDWGAPLQVALTVKPPPWLSWWAISLYGLVLLALIRLYLRAQSEKLARQRDIAEKERRISARLRQVDKLKDEFLANTSHELRTPLNGIIGLAESLVDGAAGPQGETTVKNLDMIINSGRRLASLVDDILDFAKLKDRSLEIRKAPVDMHSLTDVVLALSRPLVGSRKLVLRNEIGEDVPPVIGDENRLQQIMHNLVGNAVKFTEQGEIRVTAAAEGALLAVSVHDTGIGIDPKDQARIFESFEQADGDTSRIYGGTGLGLALTRRLVALHGGDIEVHSALGQGSCFTFTLPLSDTARMVPPRPPEPPAPIAPEPAQAPEQAPERDSAPALSPETGEYEAAVLSARILIVDDEPVNRQVLRNHLMLRRYMTEEAPGGAEALEILAHSRFDLVLLDIMMPRMNGYEVCRKLRAQFAVHELPILFLTARNQVADLKEGFAAGANDYLTKPIAKDELYSRIETHLELLRTHRTLEERVAERTRELHARNCELDARNKEILRTRDQLILSEKMASLGTLTAGIAHEIRNPLTFINGFAEVSHDLSEELRADLKQHAGRMDAAGFEDLDDTLQSLGDNTRKIREHGSRANQIVQNMIVLAKGEGGERTTVSINRLVGEFAQLAWQGGLTHLGEDYGLELEEVYDPRAGDMEVIAQNLSRAVINIVNNAMEALVERAGTEEGYRGRLKVWTQRIADAVLIGFLDNGPGIPEDQINRVFTPFFTTKSGRKNVGLGLSLCYEIVVREHGGSLDVSSEPGRTEIVMRLPS